MFGIDPNEVDTWKEGVTNSFFEWLDLAEHYLNNGDLDNAGFAIVAAKKKLKILDGTYVR